MVYSMRKKRKYLILTILLSMLFATAYSAPRRQIMAFRDARLMELRVVDFIKEDVIPVAKSAHYRSDEDFSTAYQYNNMGRPLAVTRYGVVDSDGESETFGLLDKFTLDYDGPLLSSVTSRSDEVEGTNFYGRTGLQSGLSEVPATYTFNADGRLKRDGASGHSYRYTPTGLVSEIHN